ncbi:MAG: DUF4926 domain-containing protein [Leptonema sp. (in: Bacteria)]|nr:DUF4926 domain-containing protein [Leptonema sp. (in: bacteria)]
MKEHEPIVLLADYQEHGLKLGDIGAIVHIYANNEAFEVEFTSGNGRTVAVLTLTASQIRPLAKTEILHARKITSV